MSGERGGSSLMMPAIVGRRRTRLFEESMTTPGDELQTYEEYWQAVNRAVKIEFDEHREEDETFHPRANKHEVMTALAEWSDIPQHYPRNVVFHCDNGFGDPGWERYRYYENRDGREMLSTLADIGFYNDINESYNNLIEAREALGDAVFLIEGPIDGVGAYHEYEYEKGVTDTEFVTYRFEALEGGGSEYRVVDPDGEAFEVISPDVMVEDVVVPERTLKLKLDNLCARRERER